MRRISCSTGKILAMFLIFGVAFLLLTHSSHVGVDVHDISKENMTTGGFNTNLFGGDSIKKLLRKPPRLPPRLPPDENVTASGLSNGQGSQGKQGVDSKWLARQQSVKDAFVHAWTGYKSYAMGYDELMPVSKRGVDGLGGLGATIVDALDTAMIMGLDDIVGEAGSWVETHLNNRIQQKGQVNLFETTIRVVGGLLSAYHLSGGGNGTLPKFKGPEPNVYLDRAKNLADHLMYAFTSSPTPIPYSDVVLRDRTAHPAPGGMSSTSEVSTLQLEFNYLSSVSGDLKYSTEGMKVLEHLRTLPKVEGLVPIYIRYII